MNFTSTSGTFLSGSTGLLRLLLVCLVCTFGTCVPARSCPLQSEPEIENQFGYNGSIAFDYAGDGLSSPNYVTLLWDLTGLAAHVEKVPNSEVREWIAFSRKERNAIRNALNELLRMETQVYDDLRTHYDRIREEQNPDTRAVLQRLIDMLEQDRNLAYRRAVAEVAPLMSSIQQRQLREIGVGIALTYNSLDTIFAGAHEHLELEISAEQLEDMRGRLKPELANLVLEHARSTGQAWGRLSDRLPAKARRQIEALYGIDVLEDQ